MARHYRSLSKTQYTKGRKCHKALWLYQHKKEVADPISEFQQSIFDQGTAVGELATQCFPGGLEITEDHTQLELALEKTRAALLQSPPALFEPAFLFEDVLVRVDILRAHGDGSFDLIEVKSSTSVNPKAHYDDVAVQKWVLENCGLKIRKAFLMHLNRDYIRKGKLNLDELFVLQDLTGEIRNAYKEIPASLAAMKRALEQEGEPYQRIGSVCKNPYGCEFMSYCWQSSDESSIHSLSRLSDKKRHELMDLGIQRIQDIPEDYPLSDHQCIEVQCVKGEHVHINVGKIKEHLSELTYPLYFLDFETVSYAVPPFEGCWPYRQLTTQYSLHIQNAPGAPLEHKEFLHMEHSDPTEAVAKALVKDIPQDQGSVIVYSASFEKGRILEMAKALPELKVHLEHIASRLWDLEVPFAKRWYWDSAFLGQSSIKKVLPVLAPEISYEALQIRSGDAAKIQYEKMVQLPAGSPEQKAIQAALLEYCKLDTWAMVLILKKLADTLGIEELQLAV